MSSDNSQTSEAWVKVGGGSPFSSFACEGKALTPEEVEALGLVKSGVLAMEGWDSKDIVAFDKAMMKYKSDISAVDFWKLHTERFPHKTPQELAGYFYNVWCSQSTDASQAWFLENPQA